MIILIIWVALNAMLAWYPAHPKKIYPDHMTLTTTPSEYGLKYEDVMVVNGLLGWFIPTDTACATVILVHGWASCREEKWVPFLELARHLHNQQMNVLLYDARYVNSSKTYSGGERESKDLIDVVNWAVERTEVPVVVWGFSAGGHATLLALSNHDNQISCAITDSAFVNANESFKSMYRRSYHIPPFTLLLMPLFFKLFTGYFPSRLQHGIKKPLFVIHGDSDTSISIMNGRSLKQFLEVMYWEVSGVGHEEAFIRYPEEYISRCIGFIDRTLEVQHFADGIVHEEQR